MSQILRAQVLPGHFERPAGFDLAAHWQASLDDFDARRRHGEAVLLLTPAVLDRLPDLVEPAVARAARDSAGPPDPDGRVRVVVPVESADNAVGVLLRLGAGAEVVSPPDLRARMVRTVTALADVYRASGGADTARTPGG
ncbi:WYL domain-containing protein [Streptomyces sp. NPDC002734]|uniref:helix-turn-helix transcriptional regulator n=1 Tax=Streptomyces sp. NPDC002734 TaxID=3154426 RepID=UPI003318EAE6